MLFSFFAASCAFYFFDLRGFWGPIAASVFLSVVYVTEPPSCVCANPILMNFFFLLSGMALFAITYLDGRFSSLHMAKF